MPKYDMFLKPGDDLPENLKEVLHEKFNEKNIEKLKRFGGRIQISLTAPFTDKKKQNKSLVVDKELIDKISSSVENANEILGKMTLKQIRAIAKLEKYPISAKTTVEDARKQLISVLFSNETWNKISK